MPEQCPTTEVTLKANGQKVTINTEDFDPALHKLVWLKLVKHPAPEEKDDSAKYEDEDSEENKDEDEDSEESEGTKAPLTVRKTRAQSNKAAK